MSGYKGPLKRYVGGDLNKEQFVELLKSKAPKSGIDPKKKVSLPLEEDGDGVLSESGEFGYAFWVGDISKDEYEEFLDAMGQ